MKLDVPDDVELMTDLSPARWVTERLWPWGAGRVRVGSLVPEGFEAYARILHPAYRVENGVGTVRWSTLAERSGRALGPESGFRQISGLDYETPEWDEAAPTVGSLPREQVRALTPVLQRFTSTPGRCWFCIWNGFGFWPGRLTLTREPGEDELERQQKDQRARERVERESRELAQIPVVHAENRDYFLFRGPISTVEAFACEPLYQSPNLWWPDDRAWCLASDIDAYSSYMGGSRACVDEVLRALDLEAVEVSLGSRLEVL